MKLQSQNPQGPRSLPSTKPTQPPTPPTPPPPQNQPDSEKLRDQLLESIVSNPEFTKEAMRRVGRGDKVSINVDGRPLVSITSEGPTVAERVIGGFRAGVRSVTEEGAVILVKGSQNTIYLEECVKILCDMTEDVKLVRQSLEWQKTKEAYFSQYK